MKTLLISVLIFGSGQLLTDAPIKITWENLKVEYKDFYHEALDAYYWEAQFKDEQKSLDSQRVQIEGFLTYYDDEDPDNPFIILSKTSASPFSCCAMGTPDRMISLDGLSLEDYKQYSGLRLSVTGILSLNLDYDITRMDYVLTEVVIKELSD